MQILAFVCFALGLALLGAHVGVCVIAGVGTVTAGIGLRKPADETPRRHSRAAMGALLASARLIGLTLVSDEGAEVAEAYGLAHEDPFHGKVSLPATILIDREGRLAWAHIAADIAHRPSPEEIIEQVSRLRRSGP